MLRSEKKSLFRFLVIYMITTMALFTLTATLFFTYEKHRLLDQQRGLLKTYGENLTNKIRNLHESSLNKLPYPINTHYHSALFDINKAYIFGDFHPKDIDFDEAYHIVNKTLYHVKPVIPYYLGAAYIVLKSPIDEAPIQKLFQHTLLFLLVTLFIFLILGYFLGRLFTAPMRQSFEKMNRFIQDTTHELNTPISTILTNIELLDTLYECEGKEERKRIEIASKTLSRLYDDMTYLTLNHEYHRNINSSNISQLLRERIDYFSTMIETKKIRLKTNIDENISIMIDKNDATRLIDNLLSNAIKYNRQKGTLTIILNKQNLIIEDSGIGMHKEALEKIFKRFERSNESEGGFGIGMDIVHQIITFYNFSIDIQSKPKLGTKVSISWAK